jgi:aryl-alcohol dehydrogenase-like predicted oxidoreductase
MSPAFEMRDFGQTGLRVSAIGLGSSYGLSGRDVERAFDRGVNYFLWGSARRRDFGTGIRAVAAKDRAGAVIAIQSYTRMASLMRFGVDRALKFLKTDYVDLLGLAWWNAPPPDRIVEAALRLKEQGKVRALMISSHHRPAFVPIIRDARYDALMLRYNAAHTGAEQEVFPFLAERRVGTLAFTATRWGALLNPKMTPPGEPVPSASDCYRFALSNRTST